MTQSPRKIAIFGATGRTGREVVKTLLSQDDAYYLHILVRSKARLETLIPDLKLHSNVEISQGSLSDKDAITDCLRDSSLIICTIGNNNNEPGMRIFQDTAVALTAALSDLRAEAGSSWERPHLTLLTSASTNETFVAQRPRLLEWLLSSAFNHVYHDLLAGDYIFSSFSSLMTITFVHAPLIVEGERTGYRISADTEGYCVSYQDLGEAMAMLAIDPQAAKIGRLGVESAGTVQSPVEVWRICITNLFCGFLGRFIPGY